MTYRVLVDHLGSVRSVVRASDGALVQRMDYDAFGVVLDDWSASGWVRIPYGFAGGLYDRETGLVRFGAREYDARVGRWVSRDPALFGGGDSNLYRYCGEEPVNFIDPEGEDAIYIRYVGYPVATGIGDLRLPLGHAAVIAVDPRTGRTSYYEYGRYDSEGLGIVRRVPGTPRVRFGRDGSPTPASLNALYRHVSRVAGRNSRVDAVYFRHADHRRVIEYAEGVMHDRNRSRYNLLFNNCYDFARESVEYGTGGPWLDVPL